VPTNRDARRLARSSSAVPRARSLVLTLAFALACALACTTEAPPALDDGAFTLTNERALAWQVSKRGEDRVDLYLLGSVHMLDAPLRIGPQLEDALGRSDALVLEVDLRQLTPTEASELWLRYGMLAYGERLSDFLSPDTLDLLDAYLQEAELAPQQREALGRMLPWSIAMTLEVLRGQAAGLDEANGVDRYFLEHAPRGTEVIGLETLDEQLFALSSQSNRTQDEMLRQVLTHEGGGDPGELIETWKQGDARALSELVFPEDAGAYDELYETLYFARNARMAEGLLELLEEGPPGRVYFAVLGAAHLIGDSSVQEMLRAGGYESIRMSGAD